ncbi:MAG TPA: hypothetical protein VGC08_11085 [Pedobacter sp.]
MNTTHLFQTINHINPLSKGFQTYLSENLNYLQFNMGDHIPYLLPVSHTIYFIDYGITGGIRVSGYKKNTLWFADQGKFIFPEIMPSAKPFIERIEFLMPTLLIGMEMDIIIQAAAAFPEARQLLYGLSDRKLAEAHEREIFLRLSPDERFHSLVSATPALLIYSHAPQLASYLNISVRQLMRYKGKNH